MKPEKKHDSYCSKYTNCFCSHKGVNKVHDQWEAHLPSEDEIYYIIKDNLGILACSIPTRMAVKAIYKRLRGER